MCWVFSISLDILKCIWVCNCTTISLFSFTQSINKLDKNITSAGTIASLDSQSAAPFVWASPLYTKLTPLCLPVPQALGNQ